MAKFEFFEMAIMVSMLLVACNEKGVQDPKTIYGTPISMTLESNSSYMVTGEDRVLRLYPCVQTDQGKRYPFDLDEVIFFSNGIPMSGDTFSTTVAGDYFFSARFRNIASDTLVVHVRADKVFDVYEIPLLFHIYRKKGEAPPIDHLAIQTVVEQLNQVFRRMPGTMGWNDRPSGIDTYLQFHLATLDSLDQPLEEAGVVQREGVDMNLALDFYFNWDMAKYLNIHLFYETNNELTRIGYAEVAYSFGDNTFPGIRLLRKGNLIYNEKEFAEVEMKYFASAAGIPQVVFGQGNAAFLLAHEVGHVFGLHHTFVRMEETDFCDDTRPYLYPDEKLKRYCGWEISSHTQPYIENINIMDYESSPHFEITYDQRERMRWVLDNSPWLRELKYSPK